MTSAGYFTVGANDLKAARGFYDALLGPLGFTPFFEFERGCIYAAADKATMFAVLTPENGEAATPGNGAMGGFRVESGEAVAAFHAKALELGATSEGEPGERIPGAHFGYVRDPEGNKLCAFSVG